jgi:hypothetical protein
MSYLGGCFGHLLVPFGSNERLLGFFIQSFSFFSIMLLV